MRGHHHAAIASPISSAKKKSRQALDSVAGCDSLICSREKENPPLVLWSSFLMVDR